MWRYGLATLPAAALILINNYAISGSPFKLSYGSNPLFPELAATTGYGFSMPEPGAIRATAVGRVSRAVFLEPGAAHVGAGFLLMFRKDRGVAIMTMIGCMLILLQAAAFYTWFGGNAIGPRYLAPVLPLVGLAAAYGIQRWPEPGLVLGADLHRPDARRDGDRDRSAR